ncbi:MAG TPA: hypothetical protein VHM70_30760, partial [Polyangiaceae bacterium]|nr:hypothetical protein [Polyangiaceae bacterium]
MRRMMVFRLSLTGLLLLGGRDARAEDGATALLAEDYPKAIELERATARDSRDPAQVADAYLRLADMALDAGDTKGALAAASSCAAIQASP